MNGSSLPNLWEAKQRGSSWTVQTKDGQTIATIKDTGNDETIAKFIAASPYVAEALKAMVRLIGDEDLPDNGELSGAAICDLARNAASLVANGNLDT